MVCVMTIPAYQRSARTTVTVWLMLAGGLLFLYAGLTIDPQSNCSESGECAPWLVPVAAGIGILLTAAMLGQLWANPNRGSMIDPQTGDLIWWQNRTRLHPGDEGRIAPADISRLRIQRHSEGADDVHLYDREGARQFYFDGEVIPSPYEKWAEALIAQYPHIVFEDRPSS